MSSILRAAEPVLRVAVPVLVYSVVVPGFIVGLAAQGAYLSLRRRYREGQWVTGQSK